MHTFALGIITIASVIQLSSSPNVTAAPTLLQFHLSPIRCNRDSWQCRYGPTTPPLRLLAPTAFHPTLSLRAVPTTVYKPSSYEELQHARWRSWSEPVEWIETQVLGPAVMDRHLAQHARMAANAYQLPWKDSWYELDPTWNTNASFPFGWDSDENGFRDFIFRSRDNVPTSKKDKLNDNLLFSCCPLVNDLRFRFPHADVWLVGHSLGGSLASLLGSTFGLPVVAFQAPGERMAAHRLHLPLPPSSPGLDLPRVPITHVYHNADPIPQGACTCQASNSP
ncbi:hypothetical protein EV363DRAFT_1086963, partial [Boletus edulis]